MAIFETRFEPPLNVESGTAEAEQTLYNFIKLALSSKNAKTRCLPVGKHDVTPPSMAQTVKFSIEVFPDGTGTRMTQMVGTGTILGPKKQSSLEKMQIGTLNDEHPPLVIAQNEAGILFIHSYIYFCTKYE